MPKLMLLVLTYQREKKHSEPEIQKFTSKMYNI